MEIIKLDNAELDALKVDVLVKLPFIKMGIPLEYLKIAHDFVNQLASSNPQRWLDNVSAAYQQICSKTTSTIPNVSPVLHYSELLWVYVCIMSYYLYAHDDVWRNHVLAKMESKLHHTVLKDELQQAKQMIDKEDEKYHTFLIDLHAAESEEKGVVVEDNKISELRQKLTERDSEIDNLNTRISELEALTKEQKQQLAEKDSEIESLNAHIKELEEQLNVVHLSFIETEGKNPEVIKCVYIDIKKASVGPAEMAECIHDLHIRGLLKNQDRYQKLKNIKKIHKELQDTYHFEWTYDAFRRALKRKTTKK